VNLDPDDDRTSGRWPRLRATAAVIALVAALALIVIGVVRIWQP
jgi:hypothetical protein